MLFERISEPGLSQYAYIVGCQGAKQIAVVDPMRDIDVYIDFAQKHGVEISHVLETHIHADFASGARELAERTGAALCLSSYDEGEQFDVAYPHEEVRDGYTIDIGGVRLKAIHTPGHTPEHLSWLVFDLQQSSIIYRRPRKSARRCGKELFNKRQGVRRQMNAGSAASTLKNFRRTHGCRFFRTASTFSVLNSTCR